MRPFHSGIGPITFLEEKKATNWASVLVVAPRMNRVLWVFRCTYQQIGKEWVLSGKLPVEPWRSSGQL